MPPPAMTDCVIENCPPDCADDDPANSAIVKSSAILPAILDLNSVVFIWRNYSELLKRRYLAHRIAIEICDPDTCSVKTYTARTVSDIVGADNRAIMCKYLRHSIADRV